MGFGTPGPVIGGSFEGEAIGGGGATTFRYSNAVPMPEDVGGFEAGTIFESVPLKQLFDGLLYPYQYPSFLSFLFDEPLTQEVGATIAGVHPFVWTTENDDNIVVNSITIRDETAAVDLATGLANDGLEGVDVGSVQLMMAGSNTWRIIGQNSQGGNFFRDMVVNWYWRFYFGTSASATLDEAGIEALANNPLRAGFAGTHSFVAGDYKYICYSDSLGSIASVKDAATLLNVPMADSGDDPLYSNTANGLSYALVSVTNVNGVAETYRVYRTKNVLGAAIDLIVA